MIDAALVKCGFHSMAEVYHAITTYTCEPESEDTPAPAPTLPRKARTRRCDALTSRVVAWMDSHRERKTTAEIADHFGLDSNYLSSTINVVVGQGRLRRCGHEKPAVWISLRAPQAQRGDWSEALAAALAQGQRDTRELAEAIGRTPPEVLGLLRGMERKGRVIRSKGVPGQSASKWILVE